MIDPSLTRIANMTVDKQRVIALIQNDRSKQEVVLKTLEAGIGGRQLVEKLADVLEAIDADLLKDWLRKMPGAKLGSFFYADVPLGPKLDAVHTEVLNEQAVKAMAQRDVFDKWTALADASTDGKITVELSDLRTVLDF